MRKSEEILNVLRKELQSGHWQENSRFPSEEQLMRRFHVSRITMNKITEQLVQEKYIQRGRGGSGAKVLNTEPFPLGQIACFTGIQHPHYTKIVTSATLHAMGLKYGVNYFPPALDLINYYLDKIARSNYVGILAVGGVGWIPPDYPLPIVYMDTLMSGSSSECHIACSNYQAASDMAETAVQRGHRNILVFTNASSHKDRLNGFVDTLKKHKIPDLAKRTVNLMSGSHTLLARSFQRLYRQFQDTTLILTDSDDIAFSLMNDMKAMGLEGKITVTGFGNFSWIAPQLKIPSVEQHPEEIGAVAVDELLYNIQNPDAPHTGEIIIDAELVHTDLIPDLTK